MLEVARCDSPAQQGSAPGGVAVYSRLPLCQDQVISSLSLVEAASARQGDSLLVSVLYCHPKAQLQHILEALEALLSSAPARTTILAVDFNRDMQSAGGRQIIAALEARGLTLSSNRSVPTTYNGSTIDAVFSTAPAVKVTQYQSYYSSHIPLVADIL
ncbi:Phosphatidyl-myo-inositol mannosyltransferase [Frankliniella fusca]|uniref:Phosphatidyl-myo-inositol mannosyltransferase n=1 Tax=Frankliniella fusca TaxID=407009 RepID=A0AAE1HPM2_9NEOP|nr:Phosphatidyl-myo-inositol mannosyltransferase [Frankliniella fusca]